MATLLLAAGASVLTAGSAAWVATFATATVAGSFIDTRLFGPGPQTQKQEGPRLDTLQVQTSTEGSAIPEIAGRVRLSGQVIWATRFKEVATTTTQTVRGVRNGTGDLAITWIRRTRFGGAWADGADVPLNEESERYEVDILDGTGAVRRTIAATAPAATCTAAQQTADFGSPQAAIALKVYQLSAVVGRGRPAAATL